MNALRLRGVRAGNLRDVDLDLPVGRWTALVGPSGAGKSALLFGVLEPVSRRRFRVLHDPRALPGGEESWLRRLADRVEGLQPAVAWAGEIPRGRGDVEVATALDLWPLLAEAWRRCGQRRCPHCDHEWRPPDVATLLDESAGLAEGAPVYVYSSSDGADPEELLRAGWTRVALGQELARLEEAPAPLPADSWLLLDRLRWREDRAPRLEQAYREALRRGAALRLTLGEEERRHPPADRCPECDAGVPQRDPDTLAELREADDLVLAGQDWSAWGQAPLEEWRALPGAEEGARGRRLSFLARTGLGHLSAHRTLGTLSLGESRRLELVGLLAQVRRDQLVLFDEPGMGLHGSERGALVELLRELVEQGNTVLTADPAREFLEGADAWVRLGPGGGPHGGEVVDHGPREELPPFEEELPEPREKDPTAALVFHDLQTRYLDIPELTLPLGCVLAMAGVSGSGKSTLLEEELVPRLRAGEGFGGELPTGGTAVLLERALGSAAMSTIATLSGAWTEIRRAFAEGEEGRIRGLSPSDLVARPGQGACHDCRGHGLDVDRLPCAKCDALGLREDLLELRLRGRSLREWLETPIVRLAKRLPGRGRLRSLAGLLVELGMGERRFGERGRHLSLGERSRIALAKELARARADRPKLFLLDEPCLGLPPEEARAVVQVLRRLADAGHSLWVVEHNEVLLRSADRLVELGPGAGPRGGRILFDGAPSGVAGVDTPTGRWLRSRLQPPPPPAPPEPTPPPRTEALADDWSRVGRRALESDLLRELATRSPLLADLVAGSRELEGTARALAPTAWPVDPPREATLLAVLGLEGRFQETLRARGAPACAACGGPGAWDDLVAAASSDAEDALPAGEWEFHSPLHLPERAQGAESQLLRAAGFRKIVREQAVLNLGKDGSVQAGDAVWLDRFTPADEESVGRLRDVEHHARLLGAGEVRARGADGATWRYAAGRCRQCGTGDSDAPAARTLQLGGRSEAELREAPLAEMLEHLAEHSKRGNPFARAQKLLAASSLLRRRAATRWGELTFLEARLARLSGWLLFPLAGVVLLHDQPLAGMPPAIARRLAKELKARGVHRFTDPEGHAAGTGAKPAAAPWFPVEPFSLELDFREWAEPALLDADETVRGGLGLTEPLREQFLLTEEARLRGWSRADLGRGTSARRCPTCKGSGGPQPHAELRLPCPRCHGSGWARETGALEIRGLRWPDLGLQSLSDLRAHFADTPRLARPLEIAEVLGMGELGLDTPLRRLPLGARCLVPLAAWLAAEEAGRGAEAGLRLALPLAGLPSLDALHVASTMEGYLRASQVLNWREHHPVLSC